MSIDINCKSNMRLRTPINERNMLFHNSHVLIKITSSDSFQSPVGFLAGEREVVVKGQQISFQALYFNNKIVIIQ